MATIRAICLSEGRGTPKRAVASARLVKDFGIEGDAHAGNWHRQVSLLSLEKIDEFRARGAQVADGAFGENIVVSGLDLGALPAGSRLRIGRALLEITQIGKDCHSRCAIYERMGDCIMPREGVFARVLDGGDIAVGSDVIVERHGAPGHRAAVVTLSDRCFRGERADESGPLIAARLGAAGFEIVEELLLPDEAAALTANLMRLADRRGVDLVLTTGGTGFAPRDTAPEATLAAATRQAPGIAEAMRAHALRITPRAMLSRGVSVIRNGTLIVNLPGSPKAAGEGLDAIIDTLPHALDILRGGGADCARI